MSTTPGTETAAPAATPAPSQATPAHVPVQALGVAPGSISVPARTTGPNRIPYAFERGLTTLPGGLPALSNERITFTAACPACGDDAEWLEVREDTRVRNSVRCGCAPDVAL